MKFQRTGKSKIHVPEELVQFVKRGSKFIIAGHKEPDGDCVGSQLALRDVLVRMGKDAVVCSAGPFKRPEITRYASHFIIEPVEKEKLNANLIIVDCSGRDRTGNLEKHLEGLPAAIIDHHASGNHPPSTPEAPLFIVPDAPSCTLLVLELITALGLELTANEAHLLFFGLCTDTGFFRFLDEKSSGVFEAAAKLVRAGANPKEIHGEIHGGKNLNSRILMGRMLSRIQSFFDGRLLLTYETLEEFGTFGLEGRDSDSLNQLLLSVKGVEAFVIIRQEADGFCTASLRSADKIDVSKIASSYGGGGHKNAAGLAMKETVENIKQIMLNSFSKIF
ncbi:MAG: bifunctional oligoribonuclease/PAP phosphatase NrnA [Treponema sp.]|jgi:phosphoesterase RecJ-like protein|nr:bifunctional oligoribonuclease/PAP phosphatase NrnA [Treponema sp.]